jgi:histidyl-tRNA synthetase
MVTIFNEELWKTSLALAAELRTAGLNVLTYPEPAKLPKQFKFADKMKVKAAVTVGPDEAAQGKVAVKNLGTGEQVIVTREAMVETIRGLVNA